MLLNKIITNNNGEEFLRFGNADGKQWVVPVKNMRVALNLYQPSGVKGKLVKALLPIIYKLPPVRKAIKAESLNCTLNEELQGVLQKVFATNGLEFSIFEGTPCVHQKITIQVSRGKEILGYCKASDNKEILSLFEKESTLLRKLEQKGVTGIPRALFCGTLGNGVHIFVQSTTKTTRSKVVHQWSALQEEFLATLHEKTKQTILFEKSDYYKTLTALQEHLVWLPASIDRVVITTAIAGVQEKYHDHEVEFSAFHGDFTPWNMFVEKNELFVFDFEYAALTYPAGLDRYHFELQTANFERKLTAEQQIDYLMACKWVEREKLVMYLLSIITQYTLREKGDIKGDVARSFDIWYKLLRDIAVKNL